MKPMSDYVTYPGEQHGGYPAMEVLEPESAFDNPYELSEDVPPNQYRSNPDYLFDKIHRLRHENSDTSALAHLGLAYRYALGLKKMHYFSEDEDMHYRRSHLFSAHPHSEAVNEVLQTSYEAMHKAIASGKFDPTKASIGTFLFTYSRAAINALGSNERIISVGDRQAWTQAANSLFWGFITGKLSTQMTLKEQAYAFVNPHSSRNKYFWYVPIEEEEDLEGRVERFSALKNSVLYAMGEPLPVEEVQVPVAGEWFTEPREMTETIPLDRDSLGDIIHTDIQKLFDECYKLLSEKLSRTRKKTLERNLRLFFEAKGLFDDFDYTTYEEVGYEYGVSGARVGQIVLSVAADLAEVIVELDD